ncbi:MAG: PAS domain S-box protein [Deltaproteobacteria bacterium]|nr:PAS domain S-box protein [Deltaproteobacteria bacterium]
MMNKYLSLPIRIHLMILISLLAVPSITLIIHSGMVERTEAINDAKRESLKFVNIVANEQQVFVAGVEQLVTALSYLPEIQSRNIAATNVILVDLLKKNPQYTNIAVMDETGSVWGTSVPFQGKVSLGDRKYFQDAIHTGKFSSGEFTIGRISKKPIINFGYPVKDKANRLIAVIGVALDLEYIQHNFKKMNLPSGSSFSVIDYRGIILFRNLDDHPSKSFTGKGDARPEIFQRMQGGLGEDTFEAKGDEDSVRLFAYKKISLANEPSPYLYIRSSIPLTSAMSKANKTMFRNLAKLLSLFVAGFLLAWVIGKRVLVNPIRLLKEASRQLEAGSDIVNVSSVVKGGELGELAHAFDRMAEALVQREQAQNNAEASLRESEGKFKDLAEKSFVGIYLIQDDLFKYVNSRFADILEYGIDEMIGRLGPKNVIFSEDLSVVEESIRQRISDEVQSKHYEFRICTKNGRIKHVEVYSSRTMYQGKPAVIGTLLDITERKKAEEDLRRLSIAIEQAAEDIIIVDPEGVIRYVNPAFEKITGYSRGEAIGQTPRILKSGVQGPAFYENLWNTIKGGNIWTGRITNKHKDGRLIQQDATISPLLNSAGELTGYVALKRDITESVRLEAQLRQAQKMEAIGTLAGGIAHDFNNILGAMLGYVELTKFKTTDVKIYPYLEQLLKACDRARDLVKQILTFSRQREQEKKPVAVTPIVKEAMKLLRSSLPATVEIRQSFTNQHDIVFADPTQIHQVIMNLCTNAVHAMREREGGVLEVRLDQQEISADYPIYDPELKSGVYLQLTVSDTGEGIDPAIKDKIFDPFFTTKKPGEGTGLGLSIIYGIVRDHGGVIAVESKPGEGTTFTISLPLIDTVDQQEIQESTVIPRGSGSILWVDDEEPIASLGEEMLTALGYEVAVRFSSRDALEVFRAHPERFDLVITDMTMPNMTGANLAREMLKIRPGLPIILTTGFSERINEEEAKKIGIRAFIMKPVSLPVLAQTVKQITDKAAPV